MTRHEKLLSLIGRADQANDGNSREIHEALNECSALVVHHEKLLAAATEVFRITMRIVPEKEQLDAIENLQTLLIEESKRT